MALHPFIAEWDAGLRGSDPLDFPGYEAPDPESVRTGRTEHYALIQGCFDVLGGSMGAAHGERVVRAYRRAIDERLPVVVVTTSGGARLQEGLVALVQMARTSAAATEHARAGLLQVAVHHSPTTGGVYASYGSLADVRAATPGAVIGFAGPRLVQELLEVDEVAIDSHAAESAYAAGRLDALVADADQPAWVEAALGLRRLAPPAAAPAPAAAAPILPQLDPWATVQAARDERRASGWQWAAALCDSWVELRGPDATVRAALAEMGGRRVVMIACDRHVEPGRPGPAAYRLVRRALSLAERLGLPVVTLVDTPGAEPGPAAERDGIAREIALTFALQSTVRVPTVALCVGEGGSGGALALAATDRLLLLPDAVFSVIGPEGAAIILGRDVERAGEFAPLLRLTAPELLALGAIDGVLAGQTIEAVRDALGAALDDAVVGDRARRHDALTARWLQ